MLGITCEALAALLQCVRRPRVGPRPRPARISTEGCRGLAHGCGSQGHAAPYQPPAQAILLASRPHNRTRPLWALSRVSRSCFEPAVLHTGACRGQRLKTSPSRCTRTSNSKTAPRQLLASATRPATRVEVQTAQLQRLPRRAPQPHQRHSHRCVLIRFRGPLWPLPLRRPAFWRACLALAHRVERALRMLAPSAHRGTCQWRFTGRRGAMGDSDGRKAALWPRCAHVPARSGRAHAGRNSAGQDARAPGRPLAQHAWAGC